MNNIQIKSVLASMITSGEVRAGNYTQLKTQLQNADDKAVVFYRLHPGGQAEDVLTARLAGVADCLLIVNRNCLAIKKRQNKIVI